MSPTLNPVCYECGGNCDPECGSHPAGCLFSGVTYGQWVIMPRCQLKHEDIARAKAKQMLASMRMPGLRILRNPSDVA